MITYEIKAFEALTNQELYDVIKLREEIFVLEQNCVYVDCDGYDPVCRHMLVKDQEQIVGTLRIVPAGTKYVDLSIGRVVVDQAYRRQGIADSMMQEALRFIRDHESVSTVVLSAQVAIKGLYERSGFKVISDVYLEDGIDHVRMRFDDLDVWI